jgi:integration host factor subunit alpha
MEISVNSLETPALTKAHLADLLYENIGLNKREAKDMVDAFFELMVQQLVSGTDVKDRKSTRLNSSHVSD